MASIGLTDDPDAGIFAVFDGHCGSEVSRFAARYLVNGLHYSLRDFDSCAAESRQRLMLSRVHEDVQIAGAQYVHVSNPIVRC